MSDNYPTNEPIECLAWSVREDGSGICNAFKLYEGQPSSVFSPMAELSQLTYEQSGQLLSLTALLFAFAWLMKHLSLTARRG